MRLFIYNFRLLTSLIICIFLTSSILLANEITSSQPQQLKRISIVSKNNLVLNQSYRHMRLPKSINTHDLKKLRKYVLQKIDLTKLSDIEIIIRAMEWVSTQWKHDGNNAPPKNISSYEILKNVERGQRYRCVEFGKVLKDILLSLGYVSRTVGLKNENVAYGGRGMGHVASEVWSNSLRKWIFVDPQFSIYAKHGEKFLNFYEIYELKKSGKFDDINFISTSSFLKLNKITKKRISKLYKSFIKNQFGYIDTLYSKNKKTFVLTLPLDGKNFYATFQGLPNNNIVFTKNPSDLYFPLNQTLVILDFKENEKDKILKKLNSQIKTGKEYLSLMPLFAAEPDFKLTFENNMPWFDYYEIKINDGEWIKVKGNSFDWTANIGKNIITVRSVNKANIPGIPTSIEITYK
jgi:hypothetical protein